MEQSPAVAPSPYLFGLKNIAAAYAFTYASVHAEPSGHHQRFALDFSTTISTHTHTESSEEDKVWAGADFSGLRDPEAMRRFLAVSDYCSATPTPMTKALTIPLESVSTSGSECQGQVTRVKGQATGPHSAKGRATPHPRSLSSERRGT